MAMSSYTIIDSEKQQLATTVDCSCLQNCTKQRPMDSCRVSRRHIDQQPTRDFSLTPTTSINNNTVMHTSNNFKMMNQHYSSFNQIFNDNNNQGRRHLSSTPPLLAPATTGSVKCRITPSLFTFKLISMSWSSALVLFYFLIIVHAIIRIEQQQANFALATPARPLTAANYATTTTALAMLFPALLASSHATYLSSHLSNNGQSSSSSSLGSIGLGSSSSSPSSPSSLPSLPSTSMLVALPALLPMNELRVSGSKNEPPSRPSVDWSKHRPHFGTGIVKNVSVELGKTAYLTCKVYELGDKTVSWLRPRENEILTAGKYTYIGDSRFSSINDGGSDWVLEIKDVTMDDSTNYECQISTDPKMSLIIALQVKATKARIKQGELYYGVVGSTIELQCDVAPTSLSQTVQTSPTTSASASLSAMATTAIATSNSNSPIYVYWYHNGNLLNYIKDNNRNLTISWDANSNSSKIKLFNVQMTDAGNYSCKPSSAEPASIKLHLRKNHKDNLLWSSSGDGPNDRTYYSSGVNRDHHIRQDGRTINGLNVHSDSQTSSSATTLSPCRAFVLIGFCYFFTMTPFCISHLFIQRSFLRLF